MATEPSEELTEAQALTLEAIERWFMKHDYPPSVRDVAAEMDRTVSTVYYHIVGLEKKGYIERNPLISRSMRIMK